MSHKIPSVRSPVKISAKASQECKKVSSSKKSQLQKKLNKHGIGASQIHYRNDKYSIFQNSLSKLEGVDEFEKKELSIPCGWWITKNNLNKIVNVIKDGW